MPRRLPARALVVDHAYRLLLVHLTDGTSSWWEPPFLDTLREDTGLTARAGPCVWVRSRGRVVRRVEEFHVAWLDDPNAPRAAVADRARVLGEWWWTLDELAGSGERFDPPSLPALAPAVVRGEYAAVPVEVS